MENLEVVAKINKIESLLASIKEDLTEKEKKEVAVTGNKETNVAELVKARLEVYKQPVDLEYINDIVRILENGNITIKQLDGVLERVMYKNDKNEVGDIKLYTYASLHKLVKK